MPIAYRTGVRMSDGGSVPITVKADRLIELIQPFVRDYQQEYGGDWTLYVQHWVEEPPFKRGSR
ncbi:MAG: hypothetical protein IIB25_11000, partial [Chloroflexi bacterium]|nr:hypothetical protein [Chloroflexota bacterium]